MLAHHLTMSSDIDTNSEIIQITFESSESSNWRLPECVWLDYKTQLINDDSNGEFDDITVIDKLASVFQQNKRNNHDLIWRNDNSLLTGLNSTHITCQFKVISGGIFTVLIRSNEGSIVQFSLSSNNVPIRSLITVLISFALCIVSLTFTLFKKDVQLRPIRLAIIMTFILNGLIMFTLKKLTVSFVSFVFQALFFNCVSNTVSPSKQVDIEAHLNILFRHTVYSGICC